MKNDQMLALITALKRTAIERQRSLWKRVAQDLEKPSRQRRVVNLWRVDQYAKEGEIIIVPGKLLGDGALTKKVTVAAAWYSEEARRKVAAIGGAAITIYELLKKHPDGKGIRILG